MKKIKVAEASGRVLNWAVARVLGYTEFEFWHTGAVTTRQENGLVITHAYSDDWAQGGPITQRYRININYCRDLRDLNGLYIHAEMETHSYHGYGIGDHNRPLVAAMRCLVTAKLGPVVEVPDELLEE